MKNILKISALTLSSALLMTSCIEETFPAGSSATEGMVSSSPTALEAMVGAIPVSMAYPYSVYGSGNNRGFDFGLPSMMLITDGCVGDLACTDEAGSGYDWFEFWKAGYAIGPTNSYSQYDWVCYYNFIKACNDVVGMIEMEDNVNDMPADLRKYLGQAKAFRAQLYLDLSRLYDPLDAYSDNGDYVIDASIKGLTVPLITEETTEEDARNMPRLHRDDMFSWIFSELDDAEKLLTGVSVTDKAAPSLAVVQGIRARAYLWLSQFDSSNYAKAAAAADAAIKAMPDQSLMTKAEWQNPTNGFNTPNHAWMWYLPQTTEGVTNLVNYVAWMSSEATWGYGALIFPGVTNKFYSEVMTSSTDWRKEMVVYPDVDTWFEEHSNLTLLSGTEGADDYYADCLNQYSFIKFRPANGETLQYKTGNATSVPMMRIEEMYLIKAEALAMSGNTGEAANILGDFITSRGGGYTVPSAAEAIQNEVLRQKRIEFWGEGVVFWDFKRLNKGIETGYAGSNVPSTQRFDTKGKRAPWWNFCIYEGEMQQNAGLVNNPDPVNKVATWKD